MTDVIGSAYVEVLSKTAQFGPDVKKGINSPANVRAAADAGDRFGTLIGKAVGAAMRPFAGRSADDFGREMNRRGHAQGLTFGKLLGAGAVAGLGATVVHGLFDSVTAAGDLDSAIGRTALTFDKGSEAVVAFANDSRRNLLLTKQDALSAADAFGDLFRGGGIDSEQASRFSVALTGISQNLSAVRHIKVDDALQALQDGVAGNIEPLRKLGINLNEDRVQAEAFALGLVKPVKDSEKIAAAQNTVAAASQNLTKVQREHGDGTLAAAQAQDRLSKAQEALSKVTAGATPALTDNQKLLARTELILRDTQGTTGKAAGATGDLSVASQHLHAQLGNISTELGTKLLPYVVDGADKLSDLVAEFEAGTGTGGEIRDVLGEIADTAGDVGTVLRDDVVPVVKFFADHPDVFKDAAVGMGAFWVASKSAAIWNARLAVSLPVVAAGEVAVAGAAPAAAGGIAAVGGAAAVALPTVAALAAALFATYEYVELLGDQLNDPKSVLNANLGTPSAAIDTGPTSPIVTFNGKQYYADGSGEVGTVPGRSGFTGPVAPKVVDDSIPSRRRSSQLPAFDASDAKKLHDTQVRMRDDAAKTAGAQKYAADQYAANQERQARLLEASQDAVRARFDATEQSLQRQSDAIERQISVLESSRDKILDFRQDVFSATASFTSLSSLVADPSRATAGGIVGSLEARVGAEKLFTKNIDILGARHVDTGFLAELAQKGPESRGIASALVQATPAQISALNAAEKQSRAQAQALAATATNQQFGPQALANLQRGLATQNRLLASVDARLAGLPKHLQQALKDDKTRVTRNQKTAVTK